ncbi:MAG: hypothetical protein R3321_06605 [Nitrososphaeraceae archaeon]|nr:hypothetical protein [Nitrososphaeraceae archaeon]
MSFFRKKEDLEVKVFVTKSSGGSVASKIQGYFEINNESIKFTSIAFGRIGGHNVSIKLSNIAIAKIKKMNIDPDNLQLVVQRKLIEGDVNIPDKMLKPE